MVQLEDGAGKFSCLFEYIDGDSPTEQEFGYYESFGEAAGTLSVVLAEISPGLAPVYLLLL